MQLAVAVSDEPVSAVGQSWLEVLGFEAVALERVDGTSATRYQCDSGPASTDSTQPQSGSTLHTDPHGVYFGCYTAFQQYKLDFAQFTYLLSCPAHFPPLALSRSAAQQHKSATTSSCRRRLLHCHHITAPLVAFNSQPLLQLRHRPCEPASLQCFESSSPLL